MPYPYGIDIAFQVSLNTSHVANLDFLINRIGSLGFAYINNPQFFNQTLTADTGFVGNVQIMQSAGKPVGCYIFSYAWNTASAAYEATQVCDLLDSLGITLEMPVFFDWERTGTPYGSYEKVTAAGITVTPTLVQDMTLAFMQTVNSRGRTSGWYANIDAINSFYTALWTSDRMAEYYYFWLAEWGLSMSYPCDVWQYEGDVQWMSIDVDKDYIIDERCVNGRIPGRIDKWLIARVVLQRKNKNKKSFIHRW